MEKWDLLDGDGRPLGTNTGTGGQAPARAISSGGPHLGGGFQGRLLIQKRAPHLKLMPDTWAVTGGSRPGGGGQPDGRRELSEELGIEAAPSELKRLGRLRRRNSLCDLWRLRRDVPLSALRLQKEEVADARWVSPRAAHGDGEAPPFSSLRIPVFLIFYSAPSTASRIFFL